MFLLSVQRKPFVIGFIGIMSIASAFIILLYMGTFSPTLSELTYLFIAISLMIGGLVMSFLTVGFRIDPFSIKQFLQTVMWTGVSMGAIFVINKYVPLTFEVTMPISPKYFGVIMGVSEECFFRVWICGMLYRMFNNAPIAIGTSSLIWSVYHVGRYGANINALLIVFLCGCALGASFIYSRIADNVIVSHGLVNWIAIP